MNKKNSIVLKIVILCIIAFMLLGFMFSCLYFNFKPLRFNKWFDIGEGNYKLVKSETYDFNEIKSANFDLTSADIEIRYSDLENVKLDLYDKEEGNIDVSFSDGKLDVHNNKISDFCIGFCWGSRRVVLYLPQNYEGEINVKTASGDVTVLQFKNSNININTISGDVNVAGAKNSNIKTTSGEVKIDDVNDLEVVTTSGDIEIGNVKNVSGNTTSGKLEVYKLNGFIEFSSMSGDIEIYDVNLIENSRLSTVSGDVEVEKINSVHVDAKTVSGDVDVYSSDRFSKIELIIKTTSGDIEVK